MNTAGLISKALALLRRWWCSLLLLPFMIYSLHQIYRALKFNIFFVVNYDYPFPLDIIHFFIDNFLLIVHEAGHTFLGMFGYHMLAVAGGSIFQVFLPLLIVFYFWHSRQKAGTQLALCLTGYSFLDVASYAADAGARQLPLTRFSHQEICS